MINLDTVSTKLQVVTGAAVAATVCHASFVDLTTATGAIAADATNTTWSTAATTDVVAAPASGVVRNVKMLVVRNTHATSPNSITIQHTDGSVVVPLWSGTLAAGWSVVINEQGLVQVFSAAGLVINPSSFGAVYNNSTASVSAGYATDTYLSGSAILIPAQRPKVGTIYRCRWDMAKTAAGTATPIAILRYGVNGSTADTALATFTFGAGTAAADTGFFEINAHYRTVGSGTAAVVQATIHLTNLSATGIASTLKTYTVTSAGHDSTTANTYLGVSFNGGASFSGTNTQVLASIENI